MTTTGSPGGEDGKKAALLSKQERVQRFGVLCTGPQRRNRRTGQVEETDGIVFFGGEWEPGGEYVKQLKVKNVSTRLKKLKYKLPSTRYFSLAFPETISLSPGMSVDLDVEFKPVEAETYEDTIYFKLEEGPPGVTTVGPRGFHVPVRALLSTLEVSVPSRLDAGLCPARETSTRTFEIANTGEVKAPFRWTVPAPFELEPMRGELEVGETVVATVSIRPETATVLVGRAACVVGEGANAIKPQPVLEMKLSAIGKYPHITLSEDRLVFGEIQAGTKASNEARSLGITVSNASVVPATVRVRRVEGDAPPVFQVEPTSFVVPPRAETQVRVTFEARAAGTYAADNFEFETPGGNCPRVLCTGTATAPSVVLFKKADPFAAGLGVPNSVNFGSIPVGDKQSRALFLRNDSSADVAFQCVSDPGGTFQLSKPQGIIPAGLEIPIKLVFHPLEPINYYRRLFVLAQHRPPLFVDLLGTAFVERSAANDGRPPKKEQRPAPLRHAHVQAHRNRIARGWGRLSPDDLEERRLSKKSGGSLFELDDALFADKDHLLFARVGPRDHDKVLEESRVDRPVTRSGEATRSEVAAAREFFADDGDDPEVRVSVDAVDFGAGHVGQQTHKEVVVTNTTNAKITVVWRSPRRVVDDDSRTEDFGVSPETADVPAGESTAFRVVFSPKREDAYSFAALEATAYFHTQHTFRLVNDATLAPPWHLEVAASGHSFFSPDVPESHLAFEPKTLCAFPACYVGDATYHGITLRNRSSDVAAMFCIPDDDDDDDSVFSVRPKRGLVPAGGFQLLLARFRPTECKAYTQVLRMRVNGDQIKTGPELWGAGHLPRARVIVGDSSAEGEESAEVAFEPTCVGLATKREFTIHNVSRVPLLFEVTFPPRDALVFNLRPRNGMLRGNETQRVTATFAPRQSRTVYRAECVVLVRPTAGEPPESVAARDARQLGNPARAPIIQRLPTLLVGPAACGVVAFEPPILEYPTLLVNTTQTKDLVLANASDCAISYAIDHRCRLLLGGSKSNNFTELERVPSSGRSSRLLIDEPQGILPARSRKRVEVTFQPDAAGLFEFACACRARAIDSKTGADVDPQDAALLTLGEAARDAKLFKGLAAVDPEDTRLNLLEDLAASPTAPLPLACAIRGRASFPTVVVRDARVERQDQLGCSAAHLWAHLSLRGLNAMLLEPLARREVLLNLESSPDLSKLPRFTFAFVPAPLGSPPQAVVLELHNPGSLPTSLSLHLPNERDVELEPWADEGEPTEADVKINRVIDDLKCFDVSPRGTLCVGPGESATLRLAYSYSSRDFGGLHELPVLLRVAHGKQVWLDLVGRTLAAQEEPFLVVPADATSRELKGRPVAVCTEPELAPLQTLDLLNVGAAAPLDYVVQVEHLAPNDDSLVKIENDRGTINPRSLAKLRVRFLPLRVATYRARLAIRYGSAADFCRFDLVLEGYGDAPAEEPPFATAPTHQLIIPAPRQQHQQQLAVVLSNDVLHFGRVPRRATCAHLVTIRPVVVVAGQVLDYHWEKDDNDDILEVRPLSGSIYADEPRALCRVVLTANSEPQALDASLLLVVKKRPAPPATSRSTTSSTTTTRGPPRPPNPNAVVVLEEASSSDRLVAAGSSRESLATRCTVSRERQLTQKTLPSRRLPTMPTHGTAQKQQPRPSPSSTKNVGLLLKTAAVSFNKSTTTSSEECALRVRVIADIVADDTDDAFFVPRPLAFVKPSRHAAVDPFAAPPNKPRTTPPPPPPPKTPPEALTKELTLRAVASELFRDVLRLRETRHAARQLPAGPNVPYYAEIKPKSTDIAARLPVVVGSLRELRRFLGIKATSAELKRFVATLESDDAVDVRKWVKNLAPNLKLAVENALDDKAHAAAIAERDARAATRARADPRAAAATRVQAMQRRRLSVARVDSKRYLASVRGAAEARGATALQSQVRRHRSRNASAAKQRRKLENTALNLLADPAFQGALFRAVEGTVFNLIQEVLHDEFDLEALPTKSDDETPQLSSEPRQHQNPPRHF